MGFHYTSLMCKVKLEDLNRESSFLYLDYEKYSKKENEEGKKKDFYV